MPRSPHYLRTPCISLQKYGFLHSFYNNTILLTYVLSITQSYVFEIKYYLKLWTYFNLHHIINVHSYTFLRLFHLESPQIFMLDLLFSSVSGNLFFLFNNEFFDLELEYAMFSVNSKYSVVYKKWQRNILSLPSGGKG